MTHRFSRAKEIRKGAGYRYPGMVPYGPWWELVADGTVQLLDPLWEEWATGRDGQFGWPDRTLLRNRFMCGAEYLNVEYWNKKIKRALQIRRARKAKALMVQSTEVINIDNFGSSVDNHCYQEGGV